MAEDIEGISQRMKNGEEYKHKLEQAVAMRKMWPTPRAAMGEARNHTVYARSLDKPQNLENSVATSEPSAIGGKLNPNWVEWLMGFPTGWTDLKD
jgi:DNA (cytosine-5)-methyltransferase 1